MLSLLGGTFRFNLHETYGEFGGKFVDRDQVEPKYFEGWMQWAKERHMSLDFNSTSFSHPKSGSLTLANPDKEIRDFWIEHTKRCRRIADAMGKAQGDPCIMNIWIHDGSKDLTVEKYRYRQILKDSLDDILSEKLPSSSASDWRLTPSVRMTSTPDTARKTMSSTPSTQATMSPRRTFPTPSPRCCSLCLS